MKAGTPLTCENGHVIAVAARDIDSGSHLLRSQFKDWTIPEPKHGETIAPCPTCGALYIRPKAYGYRPHTPDGWVD